MRIARRCRVIAQYQRTFRLARQSVSFTGSMCSTIQGWPVRQSLRRVCAQRLGSRPANPASIGSRDCKQFPGYQLAEPVSEPPVPLGKSRRGKISRPKSSTHLGFLWESLVLQAGNARSAMPP